MAMDHQSRVELARHVTDLLLQRHPDILAVAIEGSTAKAEDREHSDLEMSVYTRGKPNTRYYLLIHQGIVIEAAFDSKEEALKDARRVDSWWPISVDGWTNYIPMHDPESLLPELGALASELDPERVEMAMHSALTALYEDLCKMRNFTSSEEESMVRFMAPYLVVNAANYVALLNRQHFNGFRNLLTKPREFETLPQHFWEDYPILLGVNASWRDLLEHAERLYRECRALWPFPGRATWQEEDLEVALKLGRVPSLDK